MADSNVQTGAPSASGYEIDTALVTTGAGTVELQRLSIKDEISGYTAAVNASRQLSVTTTTSSSAVATVTPSVTASSAYITGQVVGGVLTFANMLPASLLGRVQAVYIAVKSQQIYGLTLFLFNANPSSSTFTDKALPAISIADVPKQIGPPIPLQPYGGLSGSNTVYGASGLGITVLGAGASLYGVLLTQGTPTFASSVDLTVTLGVVQG